MDNSPIYGCDGCGTAGGRMACGTHGANKVVVSNPFVQPADDPSAGVRAAVLEERNRCRQIAADHVWKCPGKTCDCARKIAYDIMDVTR